jgi:hypothetical protein
VVAYACVREGGKWNGVVGLPTAIDGGMAVSSCAFFHFIFSLQEFLWDTN